MISVSIVTYDSHLTVLQETVSTLAGSIRKSGNQGQLYIIDNGNDFPAGLPDSITNCDLNIEHIKAPRNVGYGRGHNIAIAKTNAQYHLVLNPDVVISPQALPEALNFLQANPECGLIAPAAYAPDGAKLYLCKSYPTLLDLALRGSDSTALRKLFSSRLARYEMHDIIEGDNIYMNSPIISGCFMLFRTDVLKALDGFDPRFFLYFEDFDISLRAARITRIAYVPSVRIVHYGGHAARKGIRHIMSFIWSATQFFNKHGWKLY